jgi:hypothetical protein
MKTLNTTDTRIEILSDFDAIESKREIWEELQFHPNADFDFFKTIVQCRKEVIHPVMLILTRKGLPASIIVGRLEKVAMPIRFGYMDIAMPKKIQLTIVYGGIMGHWDEALAKEAVAALRSYMHEHRVDAINFTAVRITSPFYQVLHTTVPFLLRADVFEKNIHWFISLTTSFDDFMKRLNAKHRSFARKGERRLAELTQKEISMKKFSSIEQVNELCSIAEKIASRTYLRGIGVGFSNTPEMNARLVLGAKKNWLKGYVLYTGDEPCSFWIGSLYKNIFHLENTGYIPELRTSSPGQILFLKMVEDLIDEGHATGIDPGFGDADYKKRFGDSYWEESNIYVFSKKIDMIFLCIVIRINATLKKAAKKIGSKNLLAKIKKQWRLTAEKKVDKA